MESGYINNWHRVWSERKLQESGGSLLEKLIAMDGFDSPLGMMQENEWRAYIDTISDLAAIGPKDSVFEIGCGCGAFLYPLWEKGNAVGGIDYSSELVNIARSAMPKFHDSFVNGDALQCNAAQKYDMVIANHVIHYFSSIAYAEKALLLMLRKASKTVAVTGVPDITTRNASEAARRGLLTEEEYNKKYEGLEILYYDRKWFTALAQENGFVTEFFAHSMPGFAQNEFRFDCIMKRKPD